MHSVADFIQAYLLSMDGSFFWDMVALEVERQKTSFEWLYRKTRVSKGTFSSWRSRKMYPRVDVAFSIAEALGVSVDYLLTGREKQAVNIPPHVSFMEEMSKEIIYFDNFDLQTLKSLVVSMARRYR